jgi:hypothetical protein
MTSRASVEKGPADLLLSFALRARLLLQPLTEEEQAIVRDAIYGIGPPDVDLSSLHAGHSPQQQQQPEQRTPIRFD